MIEVITYNQIERFKTIQKEENTLIYLVVGYGGIPENPDNISLIPLSELEYLELYPSYLRRYQINKTLVLNSQLNFETSKLKPENTLKELPIEELPIEQRVKTEEISKPRNNNITVIIATAIGILVTVFLIFNSFGTSIEDTLKQKTTEYYKTVESGNVDALEKFIHPKVNRWYSKTNMSFTEIKKQTEAYIEQHPNSKMDIHWSTFKVTPRNNDYDVTFNVIFKLLKEDKGRDKIFNLKINATWSEDLKLKSLYEENI